MESEDCRAVALVKADPFRLAKSTHRAATRQATRMYYVYVLQADNAPEGFYTGLRDDLRARVRNHNAGRVRSYSQMETMAPEDIFSVQ